MVVGRGAAALFESAINLERFAGAPTSEVLSCSPNRVADLAVERDRLPRPVVYHLFGKLSASHELEHNHCCSSAATSPTGWRGCSCAWPSDSACPIPATSS